MVVDKRGQRKLLCLFVMRTWSALAVSFPVLLSVHTPKKPPTYTPTVLCLERYSASARPRWSVKPLDVVKNKRGEQTVGASKLSFRLLLHVPLFLKDNSKQMR